MNRILDFVTHGRKATFAATLLAMTALAGSGFAWSTAAATTAATAGPLELSPVAKQAGFSELVAKVKPAIVNISTEELPATTEMSDMPASPDGSPFGDMLKQFFDGRGLAPQHGLASGFVIDPAGYIVTNNHVVDGANKVAVTLSTGSSYSAKIVGRDPKTDLAVLKIDAAEPLPYVAFGNSDAEQIGDWVVAVGNPYGLGGTVTAGIVSAHDRNINSGPYDDFLQIDAPINPGNSGGPVFNQSGLVVGIDTAIYSPNGGSVGIGFAIPSNIASKVVTQLREHGSVERGWLGVQMQLVTPPLAKAIGLAKPEGVLVDKVDSDSPASRAHIQQGDIVTKFDGAVLNTPRDLALAVANARAGDTADLTVWRNGSEQSVKITIAQQPNEQTADASGSTQGAKVGMALAPLGSDARISLGLNADTQGVLVAQVTAGGRADESGVQTGDVILKVDGRPVATPDEATSRIHEAEHAKKEAVPLLVTRNGTDYYLALQLAQS